MADDLVAARAERRDQFGAVIVKFGVDQQRVRQFVSLGEFKQPPGADAVAVVAPGVAARVRLRLLARVVVAQAFPEREVLDVETEWTASRAVGTCSPGVLRSPSSRIVRGS